MSKTPLRDSGPAARIAVIPGDGIGKEVTPEAVKVLRAACSPAKRSSSLSEFDWGADKYLREGVSCRPARWKCFATSSTPSCSARWAIPGYLPISTLPTSCWGFVSSWTFT